MFGLLNTGPILNLGNLYDPQSLAERHPNLVLKCAYLNNLDDVNPFIIGRADGRNEGEQGKGGVDIVEVITYKTSLMVNEKPVTVSLAL